jgi:hypothetical protein
MGSLLVYGMVALAILGTLGGIGYKIRESGADAVRLEWSEANAKAKAEAEAERLRQDALREKQEKAYIGRLANEKKRSGELMASLEAHIKAAGPAAQCALPASLLDDWNTANRAQGPGPGGVPGAGRASTPPR